VDSSSGIFVLYVFEPVLVTGGLDEYVNEDS
jgi:hypothetical protein